MADLTGALQAAAGTAASAGGAADPNFNQTVLLLHGDGTNGAQNNTFLDSSTNNFTITRNGNTTQGSFSPFSNADGEWSNYFDGTGDYLSVANATAFDFTGDFTVEGWFYFSTVNQTGGETTLFSFDSINEFQINVISTGLRFTYKNTASIDGAYTVANLLNTWTHIATVRSGSTVTMYVNGTSVLSGTVTSSFDTATLYIGVQTPGNNNHYFNGYMSNVSVLKGTAKYTSAFTPSTTPLSPSATNQELLTCYSNRFVDANTATTAKTVTPTGNTSVQPFSPFAPSAAYSASVNGGSGYFDGSGDYLTTPSSTNTDISGVDFTLECWVYMTAYDASTFNTLMYKSVPGNFAYWVDYKNDTTQIRLATRGGGSVTVDAATTTIPLNTWTHVAIVSNGTASETVEFFINGVSVGTDTIDNTVDSGSGSVYIGENGTNTGRELCGYMTDARIVIGSKVYTAAFTPPTAPLTAISGTQLLLNYTNAGIFDNTGKNNLETVGNAQIDTTTKKYGTGSMEFDGSGDRLVCNQPANMFYFGSGNFTVEAWIYTTDNTRANQVICLQSISSDTDTSTSFQVRLETSGVNAFIRDASSTVGQCLSGTGYISNNTWHHIAYVRNGSSFVLYIDGVSRGTASSSATQTTAVGRPMIGARGDDANQFLGFIDDLRISRVARYTTGFTPPTAAFPDL